MGEGGRGQGPAAVHESSAPAGQGPSRNWRRPAMRLGSLGLVIALVPNLLVAPPAAAAQPPGKVARVGVLYPGGSKPLSPRMEAFRRGLREHGYAEGTNVAIDIRYAEGRTERLPELAAELVRLNANVISPTGDLATRAVQQATAAIPIVALTDDLVGAGLVASHAHPGGSTTGVSIFFARTERETTGTAEGSPSQGVSGGHPLGSSHRQIPVDGGGGRSPRVGRAATGPRGAKPRRF